MSHRLRFFPLHRTTGLILAAGFASTSSDARIDLTEHLVLLRAQAGHRERLALDAVAALQGEIKTDRWIGHWRTPGSDRVQHPTTGREAQAGARQTPRIAF